jgi:hypothetical protein
MVITTEMLLVASFVVNAFVLFEYIKMWKVIKRINSTNQMILYLLEEISEGKIEVTFNEEEDDD